LGRRLFLGDGYEGHAGPFGDARFQILYAQLKLIGGRVTLAALLGSAAKLRAAQLGNEELERIDLLVAFSQRCLLCPNQRFERFDIVG